MKKRIFKRPCALLMAFAMLIPGQMSALGEAKQESKAEPETRIIIDENINTYQEGLNDRWIIPESSKDKVSLTTDGEDKVIKMTGKDGNTKLYYDMNFGDSIITYDVKFSSGVIYYEGMYNIVRENGNSVYCTNLTPDDGNDMVIETKNVNPSVDRRIKKGIDKEVWYTCRVRVLNGKISMKIWPKGEAEPEAWDIEASMNDAGGDDKVLKFEMFSWDDRQNHVYLKNIKVEEYVKSEFYVDVNGSDNNPGTKEEPFKTLEKARDAVRAINGNMTSDIIVHIGEGAFEPDKTFELGSVDSGSNGYRIIYEGSGKDSTVISGGMKISGWSIHDAEQNIYKAAVPTGTDFRQLYVDGVKAVRARSGNVGTYNTRIIGAERIKNGVVLPELLTVDNADSRAQADDGTIFIATADNTFNNTWNNLTDIELHIFTAWSVNVLRVKSAQLSGRQYNIKIADEEAMLVFNRQHPNIDGYSHMSTRNFIYYVENAYELMDEDNEWYLDKTENVVYYKAPAGTDLNTNEVVVPKLETIVKINGTPDNPVKNVTFTNMGFMYSTWMKPTEEGFVDGQAMQYVTRTVFAKNDVGVGRPAAGILVTNADGIIFDGNKISNMGATGIDLYYGASDCVISNNLITNISGNGISVGKFAKDDATDYHEPYNPEDSREICANDKIINNEIYHVGTDYECGVAIAAGYPKNILIANNTIAYAPYSGISVGFGWTKAANAMSGNRILRNEIHHVTTVLCDAGAIYTLSEQPDSQMWGNYIHDITLQPWADYGTCGIYLDEGTGGYYVTENVLEKAFEISPHATGVNRIINNHIKTNGVIDTEKANEIKSKAGVQAELNIDDLDKVPGEDDLPQFTYTTIFEDDFEKYAEGAFVSDKWSISDAHSSLVNIISESGGNVLRITGKNANTKVYANIQGNGTFGNNVTTFDFNFVDELVNFDGMYNVVRRSSLDYTANLTPEHSTTVRLEAKGSDEVGDDKEISYRTWYTCKTMIYENTIYVKVWERGKEEPEKWDVIKDMKDVSNNDCILGLEFYSTGEKNMYVDNVKVQSISVEKTEEPAEPENPSDSDKPSEPSTGDMAGQKVYMYLGLCIVMLIAIIIFTNKLRGSVKR